MLGSLPQGQGHATGARLVVADRLGLSPELVWVVVHMHTPTTPWTVTTGSYSSRFAPLVTSALVAAAERIAATIRVAAGVLLELDPGELELAAGQVRQRDRPERHVAFRHAAGLVHWDPGSLGGAPGRGAQPGDEPPRLYAEASFSPPQATAPSASDQINSSLCYGFVAEVVAVRLDPVSLDVRIELVSSVHDAGTVLHPQLLDGQVHGALVHALGGALYEELRYDASGQPTAGTFMDYLCPTSAEAAFPLVSAHLETPSPYTTLGAKGCGEGSSMSLPGAIANAVADALAPAGLEVTSLPLPGNAIHELLRRRERSEVARGRRTDRCP